ncbi:hypothetical protein CQA57_00170 [Helicobacter anseris]|uniref:SnoaL-like domain-containing protein n=1 Tax=Helicobacter anseris TaxID=375926 RepID=A0A3D8JCC8_9HELI|nr:hypothetical protein [Helicobacter anseris]RDU74504.1 hypothetical protein CQA57_00170 [Helicobacter anseris]
MSFMKKNITALVTSASLLVGMETILDSIEIYMQENKREDVKIYRILKDDNFIVLHSEFKEDGVIKVGFDILSIKDKKITKSWKNITLKAPNNPSGHTQIDGVIEIDTKQDIQKNKKIVKDFINDILIQQKDNLDTYIDKNTYIQHNSDIKDGLEGLMEALQYMQKNHIKLKYSHNILLLGEGNFVLAVSQGELGAIDSNGKAPEVIFYDLFRLQNGKLVEHWDIITPFIQPLSFFEK